MSTLIIITIITSIRQWVERVTGEILQTREHLALEVLKNWEDVRGGSYLMPEYFETRSLFCNERPGEQVLPITYRLHLFTMVSFSTVVKIDRPM